MRYDDSARLMVRLMRDLGASDLGAFGNFFEVEPDWRCPCCFRSKPEMARLDKNGNLLCSIHWHHDHFSDYISSSIREVLGQEMGAWAAIRDSFVRFPGTLICNDCNVAEPVAKNIVAAPEQFSFTPYEIASFIIVDMNAPHRLDAERAHEAYDAAIPAMKLISKRLRAINDAVRSEPSSPPEAIAAAAARVVNDLRRKMRIVK